VFLVVVALLLSLGFFYSIRACLVGTEGGATVPLGNGLIWRNGCCQFWAVSHPSQPLVAMEKTFYQVRSTLS